MRSPKWASNRKSSLRVVCAPTPTGGISLPVTVVIALGPWILNHSLTGLDRITFYVVSGLLFTAIYLWRRDVYPGMVVHALVNVAVLAG